MTRDQKVKSKVSQTQNTRSKQRVTPATTTQVRDTAQTGADITSTVPDKTQAASNITTTDTTNASNATISTQQEQTNVQQSATKDQQVVWAGVQPGWPNWPTSQPGPRSTPPAPGTRPINALRSEQFEEVGYNEQTGKPATQSSLRSLPDERISGPTSFDQPTAQDAPGKGKQRL